jgi:hypothetical protein
MKDSKVVKGAGTRPKPPAAGIGRKKGVPNKTTAAVKEMLRQALDEAGGVDYLKTQAVANPKAFLALIGKLIPLEVSASVGVGSLEELVTMSLDQPK